MLRDVVCLRSCDVPRVISVSSYHSVLIRSLRTHTYHIHLSIWGHYHVISPVIMRTALLRWLASLFVSVSLSTVHAGDVTVRRWSLTCWPHDYTTAICRFITGISMYQFIPWTYLSCSRSPLLSYRTTVTHMSLFSLRLSGENRPSLQSTTIHYVASVM